MGRRTTAGVVALAALLVPARALAQQPDAAALSELGRRAAARLERDAASWTAFFAVGPEFLVLEVLQAPPDRRRVDVFLERDGARGHVASILERDGRWLVAEVEGASGRYRPWEAPFRMPALYAHLGQALRPRTADALHLPTLGAWKGVEGRVATWALDVPVAELRAMDERLQQAREQVAAKPELRLDPAFRAHVRWLGRLEQELLEGAVTKVDLETGLVTQHGRPGERSALAGFRWLDAVDDARFAAAGEPPVDAADDPTAPDARGDLLMFGHCPWWRRGMAASGATLDARLLELGAGRVRRVPFRGASAQPGCFSRDRTRVYVSGREREAADVGLFEVDLRTGANRRLGGPLLAAGDCLFPALAPDGEALAVLHADRAGWGRVHLVDARPGAGDTATPLGPALVGGGLAWLPGGEALLLVTRDAPGGPERLTTLDRSGKLTPLRAGSAPVPLPDGRVLFFDPATGLWHTCDARGGDTRPFFDGLPGLVAPSLAPDGGRAVFVEPQSGLVLVDLASGARRTLGAGEGLFGATSWR